MNFIGQQFGNYRLERRLGGGGFADVYLGQHIHITTQQVAIKVLHITNTDEQLFRQEAERTAALRHPNIVRLYDFGIWQGIPFLVLDYAPNGSLASKHQGQQLPPATIIQYLKQIAAALQYAHDHNIIHRDIKPDNILVGSQGELLVSDFGIAVLSKTGRTSIQSSYNIGGTPYYMAPEMFKGRPEKASDQYSLGIMVYQWICGTTPFTEGDFIQLGYQHAHEPIPALRTHVPTIPLQVEQVVVQALSKNSADRFLSIKAFAGALEQASLSRPPATNQPRRQSHWQPLTVMPQNQASPQTRRITPPPQPLDLDALYREGVNAQVQGDLEQAAVFWQQILDKNPHYGNGVLASQMTKLREELHALRIQTLRNQAEEEHSKKEWKREIKIWSQLLNLQPEDKQARLRIIQALRKQAEEAHSKGEWEKEIRAWSQILKLEPEDAQAEERISVAEHNQKYGWMYTNAAQLVAEGNLPAAGQLLETLWHDAPDYGDPARLAAVANIPSYEQRQTVRQKVDSEMAFLKHVGLERFGFYVFFFCLVAGTGSSIGTLTQSLVWGVASALAAALLMVLGYKKAMGWFSIISLTLIGAAIAFFLTRYSASLSYSQLHISQIWLLGNRTLWIGRQIRFGVIAGLISSAIAVVWGLFIGESLENTYVYWFFMILILLPCIPIISFIVPLFGGGFGFGFGWFIQLMGLAIGLVGGTGAMTSIFICLMRLSG